jgi:outer membrane receptor protein involved in Fe transport
MPLSVLAAPAVLEEVIVTAQKRVESLQDVPISVAVTQGEKLSEYNITNLEQLTYSIPNLFVAENPIGNYIFIRGIGSQTNQGIEQSVPTFSDGIYRGRMQQSRAPFLDLARIEVLRGPQSILFGKNSTLPSLARSFKGIYLQLILTNSMRKKLKPFYQPPSPKAWVFDLPLTITNPMVLWTI